MPQRSERRPQARAGAGPGSRHPPDPAFAPAGWLDLTPAEAQRLREQCDPACLEGRARKAALEGDVDTAGRSCLAADPGRGDAYGECLFRAAETLATARGSADLAAALTLCGATDHFATPCSQHVVALALPPVPPADQPGQREIAAMLQAEEAVRRAVGPQAEEAWAQMAWALWVRASYETAEQVTGDLVQALPARAQPHVRAAAAWRLLRDGAHGDPLAAASDLREHLAVAGALPEAAPRTERVGLGKPPDFWEVDLDAAEEALPAAWCLGPGRRAVARDEGVDLLLVVLEASARLPSPPPFAYYRAAMGPEQPELVRWTAVRLAAALYPAALQAAALHDASPLVGPRLQPLPVDLGLPMPGGPGPP